MPDLQAGLVQRLLDDTTLLDRGPGGEEEEEPDWGEDAGMHEQGSSQRMRRLHTDPLPGQPLNELLSEEENGLIEYYAYVSDTRPGSVGVPAEGQGRGWWREKRRPPLSLTALVSPRRTVGQETEGPRPHPRAWASLADHGGNDGEDPDEDQGKSGGEGSEDMHIGAHRRVGRLLSKRGRSSRRSWRIAGSRQEQGGVVEVDRGQRGGRAVAWRRLPLGEEGLGTGGARGDVVQVTLAPEGSAHVFVSFVPTSMRAGADGEVFNGSVLLAICAADAAATEHMAPLAMEEAARAAVWRRQLQWEGSGCYVTEHELAAVRIQSRHRGAMARDRVRSIRMRLDALWQAKYGGAPLNVTVVGSGDTFIDLAWDMPRGLGLGPAPPSSQSPARAEPLGCDAISGQTRGHVEAASKRKRRRSVWGRTAGSKQRGLGGADVVQWDEMSRVAVAAEFEIRVNGCIQARRFAWHEVFAADAHDGDGTLHATCRVSDLPLSTQLDLEVRLRGVPWKPPHAVWGPAGQGGGSWRCAALQMIQEDGLWVPTLSNRYASVGLPVRVDRALQMLDSQLPCHHGDASPGLSSASAAHGPEWRGEGGMALVGPARAEGAWSDAIAAHTLGVQATRLSQLQALVIAAEEEAAESAQAQRERARMSREQDEYAALPEFLRRQIPPPAPVTAHSGFEGGVSSSSLCAKVGVGVEGTVSRGGDELPPIAKGPGLRALHKHKDSRGLVPGGSGGQILRLPSTEEDVVGEAGEWGSGETGMATKGGQADSFSRSSSAEVVRGYPVGGSGSGWGRVDSSGSYEARLHWKLAGQAVQNGDLFRMDSNGSLGDCSADPVMKGVKTMARDRRGKGLAGKGHAEEVGVEKEVPGTGQKYRELNWKLVRTKQVRVVYDAFLRYRRGQTPLLEYPSTGLGRPYTPAGAAGWGEAEGGGNAGSVWLSREFLAGQCGTGEMLTAVEAEYVLEMLGVTMPLEQIESMMAEWGMLDGTQIDFAGVCWMLDLRKMGKSRRAVALSEKRQHMRTKDVFSRRSSTSTVLSGGLMARIPSTEAAGGVVVRLLSGGSEAQGPASVKGSVPGSSRPDTGASSVMSVPGDEAETTLQESLHEQKVRESITNAARSDNWNMGDMQLAAGCDAHSLKAAISQSGAIVKPEAAEPRLALVVQALRQLMGMRPETAEVTRSRLNTASRGNTACLASPLGADGARLDAGGPRPLTALSAGGGSQGRAEMMVLPDGMPEGTSLAEGARLASPSQPPVSSARATGHAAGAADGGGKRGGCSLSVAGGEAVAPIPPSARGEGIVRVRFLMLYNNSIADAGATVLSRALGRNSSITHLSLKSNHVADYGLQALALALRHNTALKVLDLTINDIGDRGVQSLAEALGAPPEDKPLVRAGAGGGSRQGTGGGTEKKRVAQEGEQVVCVCLCV